MKIHLAAPPEGWKQGTMYLVDVAWNANNPIHRVVFYCGFIHNGEPAQYSYICGTTYVKYDWSGLYYFKVVRELASYDELRTDKIRLPNE